MYQEFLDALMTKTPEGISKAIVILQNTLGKQREVIQAARTVIADQADPGSIQRLEKALRKYDKL